MILQMNETRVWRSYRGGKLLDELHGRQGSDGDFPEDWLASVVEAINPPHVPYAPDHVQSIEGLSEVTLPDGSTAYLRDLITKPFGVLTKFLDSAERLPIQVHPDIPTAWRLFQSEHGKTEAWYILNTRTVNGQEPCLFMGFREDVTPALLCGLFEKQDIDSMVRLMHRVPVTSGDVFLIRGGMPHAIGPGVLLLEVQEPTDYTISLETSDTQGNPLPEKMIHQGVGFDRMFECFHYETTSLAALLQTCKLMPKPLAPNYEALITYEDTPCFALRRRTIDGRAQAGGLSSPHALVVTRGSGTVDGIPVRQGGSLFVSGGHGGYEITGKMELLECLPPQ
jgi:mannose-6-phosphate isomerase